MVFLLPVEIRAGPSWVASVSAWALALLCRSGEKQEANPQSWYRSLLLIKHFWLFPGKLSVVIVFIFYIIIGNLTALDYNLIMLFIFMFKILKNFFSSTRIKEKQNQEVRNNILLTTFLRIYFTKVIEGSSQEEPPGRHRQPSVVSGCLEMGRRSSQLSITIYSGDRRGKSVNV